MVRIPTDRAPTHPGEMLLEEFLKPMGVTQRQLAQAIHVPYQRINEVINGRRGMTPSTALRLEKFLGMSSGFWMDLQLRWDLYHAQKQDEKNWSRSNPTPLRLRTDFRTFRSPRHNPAFIHPLEPTQFVRLRRI